MPLIFKWKTAIAKAKHWDGRISSQHIRSFLGGRHKDDRGLYVSTGGFTKDALYEADRANVPLTLWTLDELARTLMANYQETDTVTKQLMPLGGQAQFIEQPVAPSTQDARINPLLDYLREHLNQIHSIDALAQRAAMSRRTFTRHFSKATGMSFKDWLINERLQRTRELLESTSLPVETISDLVGFQTPTSLRQHFKRRNQVSPSEWRRTFGCG